LEACGRKQGGEMTRMENRSNEPRQRIEDKPCLKRLEVSAGKGIRDPSERCAGQDGEAATPC
jgi:hypothetical protein